MGLIYLDSCICVYAIESASRFHGNVIKALARHPEAQFAVSHLVMAECLVGPLKSGNSFVVQDYEALFKRVAILDIAANPCCRCFRPVPFFYRPISQRHEDLIKHLCIVQLEDGRVLVKRLRAGRDYATFDPESTTAEPIEGVRLVNFCKVEGVRF